jgi:hypothetical protein
MSTVAAILAPRRANLVAAAAVVLAPLALVLVRLLPAYGAGLALRLAAAGACALLLPGALIVRALRTRLDPASAVAAALAWSLVALFVALAATFAFNRSLTFTLGALAGVCLLALVAGVLRSEGEAAPRVETRTVLGLAAAGLAIGAVVWSEVPPIQSDALEHLGRARKLDELPRLESFRASEMFREGNPHPGYAFPLWHGALALVARLADVDAAAVVRWFPALLTPLVLVVTYAAGAALFRSRWGGIAVVASQLALFGLPPRGLGGLGLLETVTGPAHSSLLLLVPALLALALAFVERGDRALLLSVGAAAFALAVVHPSYAPCVVLSLGGFAVARLLLAPDERRDAVRCGLTVAAVSVAVLPFLAWLAPLVAATEQATPDPDEWRRQMAWYAPQLDFFGESFRLAPRAIAAAGPVAVAGLLAIPCAVFARRSRWSALVFGTTLPIFAILLVPPLFTLLSDFASLSQSRRLAGFLPLPFAIAGIAVLLARLRIVGVVVAIGVGIALQLLYPGDFGYNLPRGGGPSWPVWFACLGGTAAFIAAVVLRRRGGGAPEASRWAAAVALALIAPIAVLTLSDMPREWRGYVLSPGLVAALRSEVRPGEVVLANERVSYHAAAFAPVYVAASEHAWDRPFDRIRDVRRFFATDGVTSDAERRRILARYGATWVIVEKKRPAPRRFLSSLELVYDGKRFALYHAPFAWKLG